MKLAVFRTLRRAASISSGICLALAASLTAVYVGLISFEVFARYLFMSSKSWTFELATYLFLISVFLGTATAFWEQSHLSIFSPSQSGVLQKLHRLCIDVICLVICGYLVYYGYKYAVAGLGRISPSMGFRMAIVYSALPVSFFLSTIFIVVRWTGEEA